ncbi:MAG: type II secretion system inner membrane protein GspF [Gammaproteobacteria bacterium]
MPAFDYVALTAAGARRRGVTEADSEHQARARLREQGLLPLEIRTARRSAAGTAPQSSLFGRGPHLSGDQVVLFTRLLGTLLNSGLPLDDALTGLAKQATDANFKRIALDVRARVLEGQGLAAGLDQFPRAFPAVYRATIAAGAQTRHLPAVLTRLADFMEERQAMRQRLRLALIYPLVLSVVATAVVIGLLTFVVPEVVKVFDQMERELPPLTRYLIATGDFLRAYGVFLAAALLAGAWAVVALLRRPALRFAADRLLLRLPIAAGLIQDADSARFARTLSILLGSGLNMIEALRIAQAAVANRATRREVEAATERVREGAALSQSLGRVTGLRPLLAHLVANGEQSGELPRMLDSSAEAHERGLQTRLAVALGLAEPALILLMGSIVLVIVLAILLPIFDMNRLS